MAKRANGSTQSKGKKGRKLDRNTDYCTVYRNTNRRLTNKLRKLLRHMKKMPNDLQAEKDYNRLEKLI